MNTKMEESVSSVAGDKMEERVKVKKTLTVLPVVAILVGNMVGSGVFISPKGVLLYTGSMGLNLIVWVLCGLISLGGSLCYVELATVVSESGGEWAYIKESMGGPLAFLAAWMNMVLISVSSAAITLSGCEYLLTFFYPCGIPTAVTRMTAVVVLWLIVRITTSVSLAKKVITILFLVKVVSLSLIVIGGCYWTVTMGTAKLNDGFKNTTQDAWPIALSFYSGLWAYEGWNNANFVTEEVKNVKDTMTKAILGSTVLVTCFYLLVNVAYYSILTPEQVLASDAVAVDWARYIVGDWAGGIGLLVSLTMFGSVLTAFFTSSRVLMAVAREGHTMELLSMVDVKDSTPLISLYWRAFLTLIFCLIGDISELINFFSFCAWFFYALSFTSLLILRYKRRKQPKNEEIFQIPAVLPVLMILLAVYLIVVPIITSEQRLLYLFAVLFMLGGLLLYLPFVFRRAQVPGFHKVTMWCQLLFQVGLPEKMAN